MRAFMVAAHCLTLGAALVSLSSGVAQAQEVRFAGSTNGCFNCTTVPDPNGQPNLVWTQTLTPQQLQWKTPRSATLSYTGGNFDATTNNSHLSLGNTNPNSQSLGYFELTGTKGDFDEGENRFTLLITFTAPSGIDPTQEATYKAAVSGKVLVTGKGSVAEQVEIDFDPNSQFFTFSDPNNSNSSGAFTLRLDDVEIAQLNTRYALNGRITSTVPEPGSIALFLPGLAGLAFARRRRKSDS